MFIDCQTWNNNKWFGSSGLFIFYIFYVGFNLVNRKSLKIANAFDFYTLSIAKSESRHINDCPKVEDLNLSTELKFYNFSEVQDWNSINLDFKNLISSNSYTLEHVEDLLIYRPENCESQQLGVDNKIQKQ